MKCLIKSLAAILFISFSLPVFSQVQEQNELSFSNNCLLNIESFSYKCDKITQNLSSQSTILIGNVAIKTRVFECKDASTVVYDRALKRLTIFGTAKFSINGEIETRIDQNKNRRIEYDLGSKKVLVFL